MTTRLEAVLSNIEEVMLYVGIDPRLTQLSYHIHQQILSLQPYANLSTLPVMGIHSTSQPTPSGHRGRPTLPVNINQVEMLRGIELTSEEVANAIGIS